MTRRAKDDGRRLLATVPATATREELDRHLAGTEVIPASDALEASFGSFADAALGAHRASLDLTDVVAGARVLWSTADVLGGSGSAPFPLPPDLASAIASAVPQALLALDEVEPTARRMLELNTGATAKLIIHRLDREPFVEHILEDDLATRAHPQLKEAVDELRAALVLLPASVQAALLLQAFPRG